MLIFSLCAFIIFTGIIGFQFRKILFLHRSVTELGEENDQLKEENRKLDSLSMTDMLTGLMNRRAIEPSIINAMHRCNRFQTPVSLLILDLDHFKRINDSYGHDFGDRVLKQVARTITGICRKTDFFARWGGEEFLILASDTTGDNALILAEKIREKIASSTRKELADVTVSIGISSFRSGENFKTWFNRADEALYHAKDSGRNLSVMSPKDIYQAEAQDPQSENALRLEWKHEYSAGIDDIDLRHRAIFQYSNKILDSVLQHSDTDFLETTLDEMLQQVTEHFRVEEKILKGLAYAGLQEHIFEHEKLISRFKYLIDLLRQNETDPITLLNYISQDLVYRHVILKDREYSHLNKRVRT